MKKYLATLLIGTVLGSALSPLITMAARTAAPVLTGLFPSTTLAVTLQPPSNFSLGQSTTTGSVYSNGGNSLYFTVTALDGAGGESLVSTLLGTSTVNQAHGYQVTWNPVAGAVGYRLYFSTSTPQTVTQYFAATSTSGNANLYYTFTSTSSPVFVPSGSPTSNSAYGINFNSIGNSWITTGLLGIGSSTPIATLQVTATSSNATTSIQFGKPNQTTGDCMTHYSATGTPVYEVFLTGAAAPTYTATKPSGCQN